MWNILKHFIFHLTPTKNMESGTTTGDDQLIRSILDESFEPVAKPFENAEAGAFPEPVMKVGQIFIEFLPIFKSNEIPQSTNRGELKVEMARYARPMLEYLKNQQNNAALSRCQLEETATYLYQFTQKYIRASSEETRRLRQAYESLMEDLKEEQKATNIQRNTMGNNSTSQQFNARNQNNNAGSGVQINGTVGSFQQSNRQGGS